MSSGGPSTFGDSWRVVQDANPRTKRRRRAVLGVASLVAAVLVGAGIVDGGWLGGLATLAGSTVALLVLAGWAGVVLLDTVTEDDDASVTLPPPRESTADDDLIGAEFDRQADARPDADPVTRGWAGVDTKSELRSLTIEVLRTERGDDVDRAREAIESGNWTDDPRAGAYLSGAVSRPIPMRVRDWLAGDRKRRGIEATLCELCALLNVDRERVDDGADAGPLDDRRAGERDDVSNELDEGVATRE